MAVYGVKSRIVGIIQYFFMFTVFLYGQCLWMRIEIFPGFVENRNNILAAFACICLILLIAINGKIIRRAFFMALLPLVIFVFHYLLLGYGSNTIFISVLPTMILLIIYLGTLWKYPGSITDFIRKYTNIIYIFAAVSLIMYFFGTILGIWQGQDVTYYWADAYLTRKTYFHLMYEAQSFDLFGLKIIRNCGVFPEAPSYAVPLVLGIYFELFISPKPKKSRCIVYLLAMITSFSTKALLMLCMMIALKAYQYAYVNRSVSGSSFRQLFKLIVPIIVIGLIYVVFLLIGQREDSISYIQRMDNILSTAEAFRRHWLFGVGVGNEAAVSAYSKIIVSRYGYSIGATLLLAEGGVFLTMFYAGSYLFAIFNTDNKWRTTSAFLIYLGLLLQSNITFFLSTSFVVALAYSHPYRNRNINNGNKIMASSITFAN